MPPRRMQQEIVSEASFGLKLDNGLLIADVVAGKPFDNSEALSLIAMAQAFFVTVAMGSRTLGSVDKCHQLWAETTQLLDELAQTWVDVTCDDPQVAWLRGRLTHFASLARDRTSLYNVSESARREFAERRAADSDNDHAFGTRSDIEPVREFSKLETASIERAYRQCLSSDNGSSEK